MRILGWLVLGAVLLAPCGGGGVGGHVVLTSSSESSVAGWTLVTLSDGASVTGSFDVPIRASAAWRP